MIDYSDRKRLRVHQAPADDPHTRQAAVVAITRIWSQLADGVACLGQSGAKIMGDQCPRCLPVAPPGQHNAFSAR